jgi:predicted nucleic acid-binding protein
LSRRHLTLDTGALIAIERRKRRALLLLDSAQQGATSLVAPVPVVTEWWRGRTDVRELILDSVEVAPLSVGVAKAAGEAIATVPGATAIDAIVMAFAAAHGGLVVTGDVGDLERLRAAFPSVRVLGVGET